MEHIYTHPQFGENWFDYPELYSFIVNNCQNNSTVVEVGSWKGKSSSYMAVEIANSNKNIKFYCVDTWKGSIEHANLDTSNLYEIFISNMKPVEKYYTPIRKKSTEAALIFEDNSLDFVFIDACHEYDCVNEDIKHWLPKVKNGGILAGHDISSPPVAKAVFDNLNQIEKFIDCWIYRK